ncbi:MAG: hypothetical protein RLZZ223_533 [Candidatus Parcubacteria bacterium]|jgi:uncharacterized HAD superfamily protein
MHIGYDIDGVLTKRDYTHVSHLGVRSLVSILQAYFPSVIKNWTLNQPLQEDIHIAQQIASQHTISIITARPLSMCSYTSQWLKNVAKIEYNNLYCVGLKNGFSERKLKIAQDLEIDVFLDDTIETVDLFEANGINAHKFEKWDQVIPYLDNL